MLWMVHAMSITDDNNRENVSFRYKRVNCQGKDEVLISEIIFFTTMFNGKAGTDWKALSEKYEIDYKLILIFSECA
jgi:hypothetical protein